MSPQRRASQSPGGPDPGRPGEGSPATDVPPPNALFAEMLRAARELLAVRSPLDAELMVSELLGTWWGQRWPSGGRRHSSPGGLHHPGPPRQSPHGGNHSPRAPLGAGGRRSASVEQVVGEGLVNYAAGQRSPAALALLSGIACLGTPRQAAKAERAALRAHHDSLSDLVMRTLCYGVMPAVISPHKRHATRGIVHGHP